MLKIVLVSMCDECRHWHMDESGLRYYCHYARKKGKRLPSLVSIPKWCRLLNAAIAEEIPVEIPVESKKIKRPIKSKKAKKHE